MHRFVRVVLMLILSASALGGQAKVNAQAGQDGQENVSANPGVIKIGQYKYRDMVRIEKRDGKRAAWRYYYEDLSRAEQRAVMSAVQNPRLRVRITGANSLEEVRKEIERVRRNSGRSLSARDVSASAITDCYGPVTLSVYADHDWTGERLWNVHQTMQWCGTDDGSVTNYNCSATGDAPSLGYGFEGFLTYCGNGPAWGGEGWTQVGFKSQAKISFCLLGVGSFGGGCVRSILHNVEQWGGFDGGYGTAAGTAEG